MYEIKYISTLIKDEELLKKKKSKIWDKVNTCIKKGFDNEPVYNEKYPTIKIKSYEFKTSINFHDDGILKKDSRCICLSVLLMDSVFKIIKNLYYIILYYIILYYIILYYIIFIY